MLYGKIVNGQLITSATEQDGYKIVIDNPPVYNSSTQVLSIVGYEEDSNYIYILYTVSNLPTNYPIDIKSNQLGVAIGKKAVTDNVFDINMDTKVTGTTTMNGSATVSGTLTTTNISINGITIPSGANLNDYTTAGVYKQTSNSNAVAGSNYPIALAGVLEVLNTAGVVQRYTVYEKGFTYTRGWYGYPAGSEVWSAWRRVYDTIDKPTANDIGALSLTDGGTVNNGITINRQGNGVSLLKFNTDRQWEFEQGGSGSTASLDLVSLVDSKYFKVTSPSKAKSIDMSVSNAGCNMYVDGNNVFHGGNCTTGTGTNQQWWRFENGMQVVRQWRILGTVNIANAWGSLFTQGSAQTGFDPYAVLFKSAPQTAFSAYGDGTIFVLNAQKSTTSWCGSYELARGASVTGLTNVVVQCISIGEWK